MDTALEAALRVRIMEWVRERADANGGFLHREELLRFRVDGRDLPIIDFSRGIRNPASFSSTLAIVASANGPVRRHRESDDGLLALRLPRTATRVGGDNRKLRAGDRPRVSR